MKEQGIVAKLLRADFIEVVLHKSEACAHCCACKPRGEQELIIEARNPLGARIGQKVEIEIPDSLLVRHYLVIFFLPVVFLALGYLLGAFFWAEPGGVILAFNFFALSFLLIIWYDKHAKQKAQVTRVLE